MSVDASLIFDGLVIRDARPIAWMKRFFIAVVVALLVIGALAAHRAYFQVRPLRLRQIRSIIRLGPSS